MSSLVILAAAVFEILCRKTDTNKQMRWKPDPSDYHWHGLFN